MVQLKFDVGAEFVKDEPRELIVSSDMKQVWAVELDLLVEFARICKRFDIPWFIDGGSLLGAVRHHGFVPWDDDIDVCLFREDYERLCDVAVKDFKAPYFLQTYETDPGFAWGHAVLRNSETTAIPKRDLINGFSCHRYNQGISIDIFPMDNIPDEEMLAKRFLDGVEKRMSEARDMRSLLDWHEALTWRRLLTPHGFKNAFSYLKVIGHGIVGHGDPLKYIADEHDRFVQRYNRQLTKRCCTIAHWPIRRASQYYQREWFADTVYLDFEMLKVPAPSGYVALLSGLYGDWHKHVVGGSLHGGMFYDVGKSYREYQRQ